MFSELLRSLRPDEWDLPTVAPAWTVKDVAVIHSPDDLVAFVNRLNRDGVEHYGRLRPGDLIARIEAASPELARYMASLDPMAPALIGVSWAGESTSPNWFDIVREYTERWHHQQQIRLAANRPGIMTRELYYPVLDCFMRALPFTYRDRVAHFYEGDRPGGRNIAGHDDRRSRPRLTHHEPDRDRRLK